MDDERPRRGDGSGDSPEAPTETSAEELRAPGGIPRKIGHYTVRRLIASGGMGTVYEAAQEQPRRPVAIKVMKHGVTSRSAARRFEYEAQLLARLSHPGIAQVYESGAHDDGTGEVPFFAMEYIANARPITTYAELKKLGTRERLELFTRVCDAVHHGHQKGIIHRDLKPGNVLVDSHGQPKVIDFGVARATDSDMALTTLQTDVGQMIGTVQYMSPEQCEADPHDIDTRSDVYSLGVLLYHLLCGRLPYDVTRIPVHEAARVIRENPPTHPSASNPSLRGDIETIVLKALEKDRERRYQSAHGLAQDIRRYLAGEAIVARPPSLTYQIRIFARRNKSLIGAVAAVILALVVGLIASTAMYFKARQEREVAEAQREKAEVALQVLEGMFASLDPWKVGQQVTVADLLDSYSEKVNESLSGQPEVEAAVRTTLATIYKNVVLFGVPGTTARYADAAQNHLQTALELCEETLGEDHPATLDAMDNLIALLLFDERAPAAEPLCQRKLDLCLRRYGEGAPETLEAKLDLAETLAARDLDGEAIPIVLEVVEARRSSLGEDHPSTLDAKEVLAARWMATERADRAEALYREVFDADVRRWGRKDGRLRNPRGALAKALISQDKVADAIELWERTSVPEDLGIEEWIQGDAGRLGAEVELLVFFEPWCPFSQRAMPGLQRIESRYGQRGVGLVGLTKMSRGITREDLARFIENNGVTFAIAKEDGSASERVNWDSGVPSAALYQHGQLVWKGHPNNLSDSMLERLLGS